MYKYDLVIFNKTMECGYVVGNFTIKPCIHVESGIRSAAIFISARVHIGDSFYDISSVSTPPFAVKSTKKKHIKKFYEWVNKITDKIEYGTLGTTSYIALSKRKYITITDNKNRIIVRYKGGKDVCEVRFSIEKKLPCHDRYIINDSIVLQKVE